MRYRKENITLLIFILIFSCSRDADTYSSATQAVNPEEQSISVELLTVDKGKFIPYIQASGIVNGAQEVWVISETSGIITSSNLKLGRYVNQNQVLLTVENELAKLKLDLTYQQYNASKLDYEGNKKSYESGNISRSQYNSSLISLLSAENSYEISKKAYQSTFIKSPITGFVATSDRSLSPGNFISNGIKVARIVDNSSYIMEVKLGQGQVDLIEVGSITELVINIGYTDLKYSGIIAEIGVASDPATGSFPVLVQWKADGEDLKLKSGMSANASIQTIDSARSLIVPDRAIVKRVNKNYVFTENNGSALLKEVTLGNTFGGKTVIKAGLETGEKLIISSLNTLNNGSKITGRTVGSTQDWK